MATDLPKPVPVAQLPVEELHQPRILQEIFDQCDKFQPQFDHVDYKALKDDILQPVITKKVDPESQVRAFIKLLQNTPHYQEAFKQIGDKKLQAQINDFANGTPATEALGGSTFKISDHPSPAVKHHFSLLSALKNVFIGCFAAEHAVEDDIQNIVKPPHLQNLPIIYEDVEKKKIMEVYSDVPFGNWGLSINNTPKYTFLPTTVVGVKNLVLYAIKHNFRIRSSGYRHSWGPIFSQDKEILISFVDLKTVTTLPDPITIAEKDVSTQSQSELGSIEIVGDSATNGKLVRLGTAVTGEDFRRWQLENGWAMPVNTVLVEVTIGGVVSGICHGAGLKHKAMPDYVRSIEYVDCKGNLQTVDGARFLTVAAGNYGLLGVVTHATFALDKLTYAVMNPRKVDIGLAVPPINKEDIPIALRKPWFNSPDAEAQIIAANVDFEKRAMNDYYCEWFWCPYQEKGWVHTWNPVESSDGAVVYPDDALTFFHWIQGWIGGVLTSSPFFDALPGYWQAQLLAISSMGILPPTLGEIDQTPTIKTALPNALHFRRGVQNMRVRDMEFEIPLPPSPSDPTKPDMSIARKCWWDIINLVYEVADDAEDPSSPMRLLLEMRFLGHSDLVLAPYHGNELGTLSIEVLSIPDAVTDGEWNVFLQKVSDRWVERSEGRNVRPHIAKEWDGLKIKGLDAREYLRTVAYKDQIKEFKAITGEIGIAQGWTLEEMKARFSNEMFDKMIFE